jgi:signal transduction histidine kinase
MYLFLWVFDWISRFSNDQFMPHGMCYQWEPVTLWSNVIGDGITSLSYFLIPGFLIYFTSKRKQVDMKGVFLMFAAFIVSCGAVHLLAVFNVWYAYYTLSGFLKLVMAGVSMATVVLMYMKMPEALTIPSPNQLQKVNDRLKAEIEEKNKLQFQLEQQKEQLQKTISLLNSTQEAANIGSWKLDFESQRIIWSDQVYRIHEVEIGKEIPNEEGVNYYRDDFIPRVEEVVEDATEHGKPWDEEWVLLTATGKEVWVRTTGYPVYDGDTVIGIEGMIIEIDEQKKASITLEERTNELAATNKELESFSYSISHDMRAPLRAINGFSEILEQEYGETLDEEGNRLVSVIRTSALKLGDLIDDILDFSRLGRKELKKSPVNMSELIEVVKTEVEQTSYWSEKVEWSVEELPKAEGDVSLLKQAMFNLIENAVKYSSTREQIKIEIGSLNDSDGQNVYFIKDNGIGFNMEYASKIFGVFQRLHSNQEFTGTGVGLAIVKRIIHKHGGTIWVESKPEEGTTFYFKLT